MRSPSQVPANTMFQWPLLAAVASYALILAATTLRLVQQTQGHLTYALDDAYIHMAMARSLALHGTWGVHADAFAAASSSPLWTLLLGGLFAVTGVHEWWPLLLNVACSLAVLASLNARVRAAKVPSEWQAVVLVGTVLFTPLAVLTWLGMEHTLFVWLTLQTAWVVSDAARADGRSDTSVIALLAALLVATRYEGLFVVAGCAAVLVMARRVRDAVVVTAAGAVPVIAVGLWQVSHGWYFLPASILMKQTVLSSSGSTLSPGSVVQNILSGGVPAVVLVLVAVASWCLADGRRRQQPFSALAPLTVFLVASALHVSLAKFGYLYRYESYLVALGVSAVGASLANVAARTERRRDTPLATLVAFLVVTVIFSSRTIEPHGRTAVTAGHIYRQQRQMATFIARYYDTGIVAMNDIGAASFFARARIDDLMGLSSFAAAEARRSGQFNAQWINDWLTRDEVPIAIVYDGWFSPPNDFQSQWVRVARWNTDDSEEVEAGVSFYARDRASASSLAAQLTEFAPMLPSGTTQTLD